MRSSLRRRGAVLALAFLACGAAAEPSPAADRPRNVVLFVADGLRGRMVDSEVAPAMAALRDRGVYFRNSHALFPTFTMPNSSAMATGHQIGDTGTFGNTIFAGYPVPGAGDSLTPFLESDPVLGDVDEHFAGDYLDETTLLKAARDQGLSTAAIGKLGPTLVFDHTNRSGTPTIIVDDATGSPNGIPLAPDVLAALTEAGLPAAAPPRGENGKAGNAVTPGTTVANVAQQDYFADVATKVVLPMFKARNKPFVLVFWSRDPDGTQHNQGDSLGRLEPGINGPTSLAAIRNADGNLAKIRAALDALGLAETTNVVATSDHGFATISKESRTSAASRASYADVPEGHLPPGFLAIDLSRELGLPLFDPDRKNAAVAPGSHPRLSNGLIGTDPASPDIVVAANGGSDLVYLPSGDKALAARVVDVLLRQDYVGGLFVDDALGRPAGTLPSSEIGLKGSAVTPMPAIAVSFRTFDTGCAEPLNCTAEVADTVLQQGQGMHGTFSRADTLNFMAAIGPDFRQGFVDDAPVSNADVGKTLARILGLDTHDKGKLVGRVMSEAMPGGEMPRHEAETVLSEPAANGLQMLLNRQRVGETLYFDAAGFAGRTVGLVTPGPGANRAERASHGPE